MAETAAEKLIREKLEFSFDIPFEIHESIHYNDSWFKIKYAKSEQSFFEVTIKFKERLRITIEVIPEKYSAFAIKDMASATQEQKQSFAMYAKQITEQKAKVDFHVNGASCPSTDPDTWPKNWSSFNFRLTKSPICSEGEYCDEAQIAASWAVIVVGMFLSLLDIIDTGSKVHLEGGVYRVEENRYERNPINRELCLEANGYSCMICGFNFESQYGEIGKNFIHVHHIVPVSHSSEAYLIDPVKDLIPVCPNCHSMLHKKDPPYLPEEIKIFIEDKSI